MRKSSRASGRRSPLARGSAPRRPRPKALQAACCIALTSRVKKQLWPRPWGPHTVPWSANAPTPQNPVPPSPRDSWMENPARATRTLVSSLSRRKLRMHRTRKRVEGHRTEVLDLSGLWFRTIMTQILTQAMKIRKRAFCCLFL